MVAKNAVPLDEASFSVPNMVCEGCAGRIRNILAPIAGIQSVKVRVWRKRVRVSFDPIQVGKQAIVRALEEANFDAAEV